MQEKNNMYEVLKQLRMLNKKMAELVNEAKEINEKIITQKEDDDSNNSPAGI